MTLKPKKTFPPYSDFAKTYDEAGERFELACDTDPLPNIPNALLNSADIADYIRMTGMIYPFDIKLMKPASCEIEIGDKCIFWDTKGQLNDLDLEAGDSFELDSNSIVFVNTKQYFRLPDYIAVRFNLRINHVHRGILLGTGPLVDPGFVGRLLIPLHNLTTNKYALRSGDPIAWVDFTKISPHEWTEEYDQIKADDNLSGTYVPFSEDKKNLTAQNYLTSAYNVKFPKGKITKIVNDLVARPHRRSIRSSIPEALETAKNEVRRVRNITFGGFAIVALSLLGIAVSVFLGGTDFYTQLNTRIHTAGEYSANTRSELRELRGEIKERLKALERESSRIKGVLQEGDQKKVDEIKREFSGLFARLEKLEKKIEELAKKAETRSKKNSE